MTIKARSGNGRATRAAETVEQDARAWELHCARLTEREIAAQLGIDPATAHRSIVRGAAMIQTPEATEGKKAELAELASISRYLRGVMNREHIRVDHGRVILDEGRRVLDDGPGIRAALGLVRVQERRAKLLGLDEPAKSRIEVITADVIEAEIRRLEEKLGLEGRLTEADL